MSPAAEPAPGAAPAHLFAKAAPCDRLAVFSGDVLRAALHNALARCQLADVQLCCERGATRKLRRDRAPTASHTPVTCAQAPAWSGATKARDKA